MLSQLNVIVIIRISLQLIFTFLLIFLLILLLSFCYRRLLPSPDLQLKISTLKELVLGLNELESGAK